MLAKLCLRPVSPTRAPDHRSREPEAAPGATSQGLGPNKTASISDRHVVHCGPVTQLTGWPLRWLKRVPVIGSNTYLAEKHHAPLKEEVAEACPGTPQSAPHRAGDTRGPNGNRRPPQSLIRRTPSQPLASKPVSRPRETPLTGTRSSGCQSWAVFEMGVITDDVDLGRWELSFRGRWGCRIRFLFV